MSLVRDAIEELAAIDARRVLATTDAVALGTGGYKNGDRIRRAYQDTAWPERRPVDSRPDPTEAERAWLGLDLIEQ